VAAPASADVLEPGLVAVRDVGHQLDAVRRVRAEDQPIGGPIGVLVAHLDLVRKADPRAELDKYSSTVASIAGGCRSAHRTNAGAKEAYR
jgi:hypothetical protein